MRIWRMNTGKAYGYSLVRAAVSLFLQRNYEAAKQAFARMPLTTFGTPGAADVQGVLCYRDKLVKGSPLATYMNMGRFIAIECKRPGEGPTPEQVRWATMVQSQGGLYILAYSVADVAAVLRAEGFNPDDTSDFEVAD